MKLKPCPFCGSNEVEINSPNHIDKEIVCHKGKGGCGACVGWYVSIIELEKAWNRRNYDTLKTNLSNTLNNLNVV
jgi:hypothetical protein